MQLITILYPLTYLAITAFALPAPTVDQSVAELLTASTVVNRIKLLSDTDFIFDFANPTPESVSATGEDGQTVTARRDTFPALIGSGIAMTIAHLGPCGINTPHIHPRAAELNYIVNGSVQAGMLAENGARFVMNTVNAGQATLFPRGAIHFEVNLGCEPVMFVAAFPDEDPGTTQLADNLFKLPKNIVQATLGGLDEAEVESLMNGIPHNVAFGVDECLQRCGIKRPQ
jgi:hypothetical protein